jgi:hypothetical protein
MHTNHFSFFVLFIDCDPHPGNLLRTPDGKLCILDFGMVTRLDADLQLTLIEHMAVRQCCFCLLDRWLFAPSLLVLLLTCTVTIDFSALDQFGL